MNSVLRRAAARPGPPIPGRRARGLALGLLVLAATVVHAQRQVMSLNGRWQIAVSQSGEEVPAEFTRTIPVPGLVDLAAPAVPAGEQPKFYWYRRTFVVPPRAPPVALLKLNKALFGTKVFVNGRAIAFNPFCFTPTLLDIRPQLRPDRRENELVIRVGADASALPESVPNGHDVEKRTYLAGIYDDVSLILSDFPFIENIQIAPDLNPPQIRVAAEVMGSGVVENFRLEFKVTEAGSGRTITRGLADPVRLVPGQNQIRLTIPMVGSRQWSPEDPFLYRLELATGRDALSHRFGMRTFRFDLDRKVALLNGRPYALLGTNVCIFRFFEDAARGGLPWDEKWVRQLHHQFRTMNWTTIRYCIGFPPEKWYDIADEVGFLIQDEYPIWGGHKELKFTVDAIAEEFARWMRERWNHPCVVIWDAQNESVTAKTGAAINRVRSLDRSDRPWDNGWSPPQRADDCIEAHPYRFSRFNGTEPKHRPTEAGYAQQLFGNSDDRPNNSPNTKDSANQWKFANPVIINEYDWLWLNRDGSTTLLTDKVYKNLFGENLSVDERRRRHAENVALLTEYWRCRRQAAGILHFCGLGYSRPAEPKGHTSDDFVDIEHLVFEPHFQRLVKAKFAPVCLMLHAWATSYAAGGTLQVPVYAINDSDRTWAGELKLTLAKDGAVVAVQRKPIRIESAGQTIVEFDVRLPAVPGDCQISAEVDYQGSTIESIRRFAVK